MSKSAHKSAIIVGAGPGLGLSMAHRLGREGYSTALISRSATRHPQYLESLRSADIDAATFVADVRVTEQLSTALDAIVERFGPVGLLYYGPGAADLSTPPTPIVDTDSADIRDAMSWVYPAVDLVRRTLPAMIERGEGGLLFAGGLSAVRPMPGLGSLVVSSAAIRNYVVNLNAALADKGVYAGSLIIGGLVERGDIYQAVASQPEKFGDVGGRTLDPDEIADAAWLLYTRRDRPETTFSAIG